MRRPEHQRCAAGAAGQRVLTRQRSQKQRASCSVGVSFVKVQRARGFGLTTSHRDAGAEPRTARSVTLDEGVQPHSASLLNTACLRVKGRRNIVDAEGTRSMRAVWTELRDASRPAAMLLRSAELP